MGEVSETVNKGITNRRSESTSHNFPGSHPFLNPSIKKPLKKKKTRYICRRRGRDCVFMFRIELLEHYTRTTPFHPLWYLILNLV